MKSLITILSLIFLAAKIYSNPFYCADSWAAARHLEGDGVGFNRGYSTLELFLAYQNCNKVVPFLDLRGHVFNDERYAANLGGGLRKWSECTCGILGVNFFYDFRNTKHRSYHQVGAGLEFLGDCIDWRLNGYLPISHRKSHLFDSQFDSFTGSNILLKSRFEYAMAGLDTEIGTHFFTRIWKCLDLYPAVGFYYYNGERRRPDAIGCRIRLEAHLNQYCYLEGGGTFDGVFHARGYGKIAFNFPLGHAFRKKPCTTRLCKPCTGFFQPIYRDEIIVLDRAKRKTIATNAGAPLEIIFVNNTNSFPGTGTFEDPFRSLESAQAASSAGDTFYVLSGDGTSLNMDSGFTLKDNQRFLGSGSAHNFLTTLGTITIPALTSSLPLITNNSGNAITLASNNEVSGFQITSLGGAGIFGDGINHALIADNIFNSKLDGIQLLSPRGQINIFNNQLKGSLVASFAGVHLDTFGSNAVSMNISNNVISNFSTGLGIYSHDSSAIHSEISKNTLLDNATGIHVNAAGASSQISLITDNHIDSSEQSGIVVFSGASSIVHSLVMGNVVSNSGQEGIGFATGNGGTLYADADGNALLNNRGPGGIFVQTSFSLDPVDHLFLRLRNNRSNTGYFLKNFDGGSTFTLVPPESNFGTISTMGEITVSPSI